MYETCNLAEDFQNYWQKALSGIGETDQRTFTLVFKHVEQK